MATMLIASFHDVPQADTAITRLEDMGYDSNDISFVTQDKQGKMHHKTDGPLKRAGKGAATGTMVGGLAGLLAGAGVIPALAGLLFGGPIAALVGATGVAAATISGAVTGATIGGLVGALTKLGVSKDAAQHYEATVKSGGVLVGVPVEGTAQERDARTAIDQAGGDEVLAIHA